MEVPYYIFLALGAFLFSLLGTRLVILALRQRTPFPDTPRPHLNYALAAPRSGGVAVVFALSIFLLAVDASYWLIAGFILLAAISLLDDMITLSPLPRVIVQIFTILLVLQEVLFMLPISIIPLWLHQWLLLAMWLGFINLFRDMDKLDGISATGMISIGAGIALVMAFDGSFKETPSLAALMVIAAGSGFLWWNRYPAKVQMGEVGSVPLGFLLAYMLLAFAQAGYGYAALILPAYYVLDGGLTWLRAIRGRNARKAGKPDHFYQKGVKKGYSPRLVARLIFGVNMLLMALAVFTVIDPELALFYLLFAYGIAAIFLYIFSRHPRMKVPDA